MFRKGIWLTIGAVGIMSLSGVAVAGDLMQWNPRTPAGGGIPGYLSSYFTQAAAVEYGPAALVNRDIGGKSVQESSYDNHLFSSSRTIKLGPTGNILEIDEATNEQESQQSSKALIYREP